MRKKRKKKSKKKTNYLKYIAIFLSVVVIALAGILGYILNQQKVKEEKLKTELAQKEKALKILQQKIETLKHQKTYSSEIEDYLHAKKLAPPPKKPTPKPKPTKTVKKEKKPKLVIIIDDMSYKYQVKLLKSIPFKVTPSFFPSSPRHPNTPKYAKEFSHYMIHLPLEALRYSKEEEKTLRVGDSYKTIENRIKEIKKDFPNAKFVNNHTGSKFTGDYNSMVKLFSALKEYKLGFVDSKTTPLSQSKKANQKVNIKLYSRNIFLDNVEDPKYIRNQLKKAVAIAKRKGYAIAIGHPHKITLLTLKNSKDILKDVEVVYIDEL